MTLRHIQAVVLLGLVIGISHIVLGKSPSDEEKPSPERKPSVRKDQYGDPLPDGAIARIRLSPEVGYAKGSRTFYNHSLAMSRDGKRLAVGNFHVPRGLGSLSLWDLQSQKLIRQWPGEDLDFTCLAFSPDGKILASSRANGFIHLWDLSTDRVPRRLPAHPLDNINSLTFSPDGKLLASGSMRSHTVRVWDVASGKELHRFSAHQDGLSPVVFSPDGKLLALAGSKPQVVHLWDMATGKKLREMGRTRFWVSALTLAPDSQTLAAAGGTGPLRNEKAPTIWLREVATGKEIRQFSRQQLPQEEDLRRIGYLVFSPDGKTVASAENEYVFLWEVATGKQWHYLTGHRRPVIFIGFAPNGKVLVSGSRDGTALVWDLSLLGVEGSQAKQLSPKVLESLWTDLAGEDASKAYQAIWTFAAAPKQAVPLFRSHLKPVSPIDAQHLHRLIEGLNSDEYEVRERSTRELEQLGQSARGVLLRAWKRQTSPEVRNRVKRLLAKLESPDEKRCAGRAVQALEQMEAPEAQQMLKDLAKGVPGAWLTNEAGEALKRLTKRRSSVP